MTRALNRASLFLLLVCTWSIGAAQTFPSRPIEVINAFAPGGANDLNVRALQVSAEKILGQPLVQIFKQGGGGIVGTTEVATAAPDGYKILVVTSGELTAAPNLVKTSYSLDSFAFLGRISSKPYALVVKSDAPWKTFAELRSATGNPPGKQTVGTTPQGGMFLTAQHFIRRGGVPLTTVPYGGAGPALTALLGGHIDSVWAPLAAAEAQVRAGALRILAVSGSSRLAGHPGVPTFRELGIEAPFVQWTGLVAPKDVPSDRLAILRDALARMAKDPTYLQVAERTGVEVAYANADEFEKQVRDEDQVFRALVKDFGLAPKQ
ncbi:MAG: tripartite tricarboxylate transporter substrate binding protein [Betaproteobacteria bacterium]